MVFNLLSTITLLGAVQGIFLALALLNTKKGDIRAHRILAFLTFLFSMDLGEEFLYQIGFFESVPNLLHVLAPIEVERVVDRIFRPIEVERLDAELLTQLDVECGRRFDPLAAELNRGVAVPIEHVGAQEAAKPLRPR